MRLAQMSNLKLDPYKKKSFKLLWNPLDHLIVRVYSIRCDTIIKVM